ncbi:MAG: hypothetical protein M1314_00850 [Firmicutes bacterium]|nr:hypothetical protein [Bacillota bacterium]
MEEIAQRLQSAGDYLGAMMKHEKNASDEAAEAARTKDFDAQKEAGRLFARDFESFISVARTAWNYMYQAADVAGCRGLAPWSLQITFCLIVYSITSRTSASAAMWSQSRSPSARDSKSRTSGQHRSNSRNVALALVATSTEFALTAQL